MVLNLTSALIAALTSLVMLYLLYPLAPRLGLVDHPGGRLKRHGQAVPTIGGVAIFTAILLSSLLFLPLGAADASALLGAALLVLLGVQDDRRHLAPRYRLLAQCMAALLLILGTGIQLTSLGDLFGFGPIRLGILSVPFTLICIVGVVNAFNMIDGIDGLAGGLLLIALGALLLITPELRTVQGIALIAIGAFIPYLIWNLQLFGYGGRRVFLGDAGSLLAGYLAVWALINAAEIDRCIHPVTGLWLLAVPLLDMFGVMLRRILRGQSPLKGDHQHVHHLLSRVLGNSRQALVVLLGLAVLFTAVGIISYKAEWPAALMFYGALAVFAMYLLVLSQMPRLHRHLRRGRVPMDPLLQRRQPATPR